MIRLCLDLSQHLPLHGFRLHFAVIAITIIMFGRPSCSFIPIPPCIYFFVALLQRDSIHSVWFIRSALRICISSNSIRLIYVVSSLISIAYGLIILGQHSPTRIVPSWHIHAHPTNVKIRKVTCSMASYEPSTPDLGLRVHGLACTRDVSLQR